MSAEDWRVMANGLKPTMQVHVRRSADDAWKPVDVLIDTGSNRTLFESSVFSAIDVQPNGQRLEFVQRGRHTVLNEYVLDLAISFTTSAPACLVIQGVKAYGLETSTAGRAREPFRGLLGMDVLQAVTLTISGDRFRVEARV
jgi:hypothetical protein